MRDYAYSMFWIFCRLCFTKQDRRTQAEARAKALIKEDYRKLGPIKWGLVYVLKSHAIDARWKISRTESLTYSYSAFMLSALQREPSLSFLYCLPFSSSQGIQSLWPAGLCFLKKGKRSWLLKPCMKASTLYSASVLYYVSISILCLSCCPSGTFRTRSPVSSLCLYCSFFLHKNLLWDGGPTLKVSDSISAKMPFMRHHCLISVLFVTIYRIFCRNITTLISQKLISKTRYLWKIQRFCLCF